MHPDLWDTDSENPIAQALRAEVETARKLHEQVTRELRQVVAVCYGDAKTTNDLRDMMGQLGKEIIPPRWKKYTVINTMTVSPWVSDFADRCKFLCEVGGGNPSDYAKKDFNIGMLLFPGAYITATRQSVARQLKYPLERLVMSIDLSKGGEGRELTEDGGSFRVAGLALQGATLHQGRLRVIRDALRTKLGTHRLWWHMQEKAPAVRDGLVLPLYLNRARSELLAKLTLPIDTACPSHEWMQMGAALTAWTDPAV